MKSYLKCENEVKNLKNGKFLRKSKIIRRKTRIKARGWHLFLPEDLKNDTDIQKQLNN